MKITGFNQQRQGVFDDPAHALVVVAGAAAADQGADAALTQAVSVAVVVVAAVGDQDLGFAAWSSHSTAHRWDGIHQRQ